MVPLIGALGITLLVILALLVVAGIALVGAYNGLVRLRNLVQESWNQVDVELQRRHDLIPNLVATVKGIAGHERNTLEEVIRLRNQAASLQQPGAMPSAERTQVEEQLTQAVHQMLVTVEAYPELKSSQNFLELQRALTETEDRIAAGRRYFNANVRAYNTKIESFPTNIIAGMGHFEKANYFEVTNAEVRQSQTIDFDSIAAVGPTQSQLNAQAAGQGAIPAQTYQQAYPQPEPVTAPQAPFQPVPPQQAAVAQPYPPAVGGTQSSAQLEAHPETAEPVLRDPLPAPEHQPNQANPTLNQQL